MATRTRTGGGRTSTVNPSRVQLQPTTPGDDSKDVKCSGHQMKCPKLRAGPTTKNAGRAFYCCPLPRDDPKRCKFFKWHDELFPASASEPTTPSGSTRAATLVQRTNQTLGQSPAARYGRPLGQGPASTPAPAVAPGNVSAATTANDSRRVIPPAPPPDVEDADPEESDEMEEIDWDKVDADEMEREAIASTPGSTQSQRTPGRLRTSDTPRGVSFTDRLRDVAGDSLGKRARDVAGDQEGDDRTPKRSTSSTSTASEAWNPFISSPSSALALSPPHALLSPTLSSLEQLSERLHRQDRLIRASEQMKKGMRTTIKGLQEKNKELEERVKQLEKRLQGS